MTVLTLTESIETHSLLKNSNSAARVKILFLYLTHNIPYYIMCYYINIILIRVIIVIKEEEGMKDKAFRARHFIINDCQYCQSVPQYGFQ